MEPGIWLGRAEDSDEHFVGTPRGVYRCRTVRRYMPAKQWDAELFLSIKAAPWDTAQGAVPRAAASLSAPRVHFALLLAEVVRQPGDRLLTHGLPAEVAADEPTPGAGACGGGDPAPVAADSALTPRRGEASKRGGDDPAPEEGQERKRLTLPSPTGTKRSAETSLDVLDPRSPAHQEAELQVLQSRSWHTLESTRARWSCHRRAASSLRQMGMRLPRITQTPGMTLDGRRKAPRARPRS